MEHSNGLFLLLLLLCVVNSLDGLNAFSQNDYFLLVSIYFKLVQCFQHKPVVQLPWAVVTCSVVLSLLIPVSVIHQISLQRLHLLLPVVVSQCVASKPPVSSSH